MTRRAVIIEGIRRGRPKSAPATSPRYTYAVLLDAESRKLLISGTLDYILDRAEQLDLEIVFMSTKPFVARPTDAATEAAARRHVPARLLLRRTRVRPWVTSSGCGRRLAMTTPGRAPSKIP
ncbi:MAG: hypothetical protein IPJ61_19230 [Tessaracoccus sp.]|uniref:hypothetical protein n=1 Tax=Tessaracoccus sp. TaxID=1971211 RepID=UPI001EBB8390|nr:hypothetical protein [Tessaracoccus sp.]MBK7823121.1 hypothetical protein [Tessaracoccus sp.]